MGEDRKNENSSSSFKVCFVGTYPPRKCGIATFTNDLNKTVWGANEAIRTNVIAITGAETTRSHSPEVFFEIRQNQLRDYRLAAEYINFSSVDVVSLQHEFGIFGGQNGRYAIDLVERLRRPVVTTLHTIPQKPEPELRTSLDRIARASQYLVVLSGRAIPILRDVYGVAEEKVKLIHHGVPEVSFVDPNYYKDKFGVEGRMVLLTFGLLSRNKGIEFMLEALPDIVGEHPEVVYLVLGATHPEVKKRDGEEYRMMLMRKVRELGLQDNVIFYDRYVDLDELCEFIGACDIYVTPYRSPDQIASGTLAFAVGMGKAVVSTPYLYAEEILSSGRGKLVKFGDSGDLSKTIIHLIENEAIRHRMRKRAYEYGRRMIWPEVGKQYIDLFKKSIRNYQHGKRFWTGLSASPDIPEIRLDHLVRMTDDTGIIQHSIYGIPNRKHGYSTDDAARALVVSLMHRQQFQDETAPALIDKYLSFMHNAQLPDGRFHNFMDYARRFTDDANEEDTLGRAIWGLGTAVELGERDGVRNLAREMLEKALPNLTLAHSHAMAYSICGLAAFLRRYGGAATVRRKLEKLARDLAQTYKQFSSDGWQWFMDELTYGNAKLPHAMLLAGQVTDNEKFTAIGLESLEFLLSETFRDNYFDFIGNDGWYKRGGKRAIFGQQTIEAGYTTEACALAYEITGKSRYLDLERAALEWLLGRNRLEQPLYDQATGACSDGLDQHGPSMNQGAEAAICSLLGFLVASRQREKMWRGETVLASAS